MAWDPNDTTSSRPTPLRRNARCTRMSQERNTATNRIRNATEWTSTAREKKSSCSTRKNHALTTATHSAAASTTCPISVHALMVARSAYSLSAAASATKRRTAGRMNAET